MFREIRKVKNAISDEEAKTLLRSCRRAAFSVNGDDGYPYTVPVNFYYEEAENRIYFHSSKKGHKIDSIRNCDKVCFTVWDNAYQDEGDWAFHVSSCVVFGRARLVTDPELTVEKLRKFGCRYYPDPADVETEIREGLAGVQLVAIDIEHMSGKTVHEK